MSSNRSSQDPNSMQEMISRTQTSITDSEGHRKRKRSLLSSFCVSIGELKFCKTMRKCSFKASTSNQGHDTGAYEKKRPSSDIVCSPAHQAVDDRPPGFKSQSLDSICDRQRMLKNQGSPMEDSPPNVEPGNSSGETNVCDQASAVSSSEEFNEYTFNRELWKVKTRYTSLKTLSAGAFGTVWLVFDFHTSLSHSLYCPISPLFFL